MNLATIDANGITIANLQTVTETLQQQWLTIYGNNINLDSNTQAGQEIAIFAQFIEDLLQYGINLYNSFDPDAVIGTRQDTLYAINGITRRGATYTIQDVQITVDRSLTLSGVNDSTSPFTVTDNAGNQFVLLNAANLSSGTTTLEFRASNLGAIITTPNSITQAVTIILGVTGINNATAATTVGSDEEVDALFRVRRTKSVAIPSVGILDGLQGSLLNLASVTDAKVYENFTSVTDSNGIPPHSIWAIVEGGASEDIANVLYKQLNLGCGMKGNITYDITTSSGQIIQFSYDTPFAQNLYVRFNVQTTIPGTNFNIANIQSYIATNIAYTIGEAAETSLLTNIALAAINATSGGGVPLALQVSDDNSTWVSYLNTTTLQYKWSLSGSNIQVTILP